MDALTLIHRARDVGLRLEIAGNALKITGPKEAEPLVRLLAEHKTQVLEVLSDSRLRELRELREIAPESLQGDLPQSVEEEARRDRFEERAPILEFDAGLPRTEAEAIARREMAAGICETAQAEHGANPYTSVLAALRAKCPAYVPEDRWRQAIEDATAFLSEWGERAQAFGWTARELFGLHPVPERPAANYSRLSRYDTMGLIWLLHGRPVTSLTEMEAAIEGVVKVYRKLNKPALGPLGDSLDDWGTL
jgi:hypothetical protein